MRRLHSKENVHSMNLETQSLPPERLAANLALFAPFLPLFLSLVGWEGSEGGHL